MAALSMRSGPALVPPVTKTMFVIPAIISAAEDVKIRPGHHHGGTAVTAIAHNADTAGESHQEENCPAPSRQRKPMNSNSQPFGRLSGNGGETCFHARQYRGKIPRFHGV